MPLQNNTLLQNGKYRIVRFIASGGFGCTYEGEFVTLNNTRVAIKEFFFDNMFIRDEKTGKVSVITESKKEVAEKLRKSFMKEAQAVYGMHHDNIVKVLDFFEENGTAYYVMEYIDGMSLNEMLKISGALSEEKALGYIRQVAQALKYVHSQHRLHLDVKPANIMVDKEGKVKLIDFGASKHYDEETKEETSTFKGMNTPGYAPMEQMSSSLTSFTPASDIYALGATLYKLLTDITPPDAVCLMNGDVSMAPLPDPISPGTRRAVWQSMRPARNDRPQSIEEFLNILDGKVANEATVITNGVGNERTEILNQPTSRSGVNQAYHPQPQQEYQGIQRPEKRSNNSGWIIVLVCALIAVLVILVMVLRGNTETADNSIDTARTAPTADMLVPEKVEEEKPEEPVQEEQKVEEPKVKKDNSGGNRIGNNPSFYREAAANGCQVKQAKGSFVNSKGRKFDIVIDYYILGDYFYGWYHQKGTSYYSEVGGTTDGNSLYLTLYSDNSNLELYSSGGNRYSGHWSDSRGNSTEAYLTL